MKYTKKKLFVSQSVVLQTAVDITSKQRVAFVFVEGVSNKSESWDIYIDDRIIQSVKGRNPESGVKLTGCEVLFPLFRQFEMKDYFVTDGDW